MSTESPDRVTIGEAFQILVPSAKPHDAAARLNKAITIDDIRLWANDHVVDPNFFVRHLLIAAKRVDRRWTAELQMRAAVTGFYETAWTMSRSEVTDLLAKTKPQKHAGGRPPEYDADDIRAAVVVALLKASKHGIIPESYSANDLADDVGAILGDRSPGDTRLKQITTPLYTRVKSIQNSDH